MAQHVIPATQLVRQYKPIGRCNNYAVLQSIPCSPECKIVGLILLDHCLSHALTATADFVYTVDMFRDTFQLPVETLENPFVTPANIHTIEAFMNRVGYQGVVDKVSAFFTKNLAQRWHTMLKVFNCCLTTRTSGNDQTKINILQLFHAVINRTHVDYAALLWLDFMNNTEKGSYLDDVPLVSVYTTGNGLVQGMLIPDAFLTAEIRETDDFMEYETVFIKSPIVSSSPLEKKKRKQTAGVSSSPRKIIKQKKQSTPSIPPPGDDRERDAIAEATLLTSEFVDSILNNEGVEVDDTGSKIEPGSQKENQERVSDDDETEKEKEVAQGMKEKETEEVGIEQNIVEKEVEDDTNVEPERTEKVVKETEVANVSGSQETRNEQTQTPISLPIRSPRNVSFLEKTTSEDFTANISPTTATTSKTSFTTKHKKRSFILKTRNLPGTIAGMGRQRNLNRSHIKNKFITREFFVLIS
ncbi:hypothetical protein Tco_0260279 [Tanacetum coccineum]